HTRHRQPSREKERRAHTHHLSLKQSSKMGPPAHLKPNHKGKAVLAGGISGVVEICMTYPLEYVKTTRQLSKDPNVTYGSVMRNTVKNTGFSGFYRGLSSMVYFAAPKAAIRFGAFEFCSGLLSTPEGGDKYGLGAAKGFVAGLGAGAAEATLVTTAQETIKIKLIDDQFSREKPLYRNFFHGVKTIVAESGFSGIYKGWLPTVLKVSTAQATRFGVFQVLKSSPYYGKDSTVKSAAAGAAAGAVSVFAFQGIDVVKSRMQGLESAQYRSTLHCASEMLKNEGITSFYRGMAPRLTRVMCEVAITMSLYGEVVKFLNSVWITD
ncbi:unnamed protein product, partial [Ectocarpus sp. 6 AP-2014]